MKFFIIIGILFAVFAIAALVVGLIVISSAADEMYRDLDDDDQAEYIRKWKAEKEAKKRN